MADQEKTVGGEEHQDKRQKLMHDAMKTPGTSSALSLVTVPPKTSTPPATPKVPTLVPRAIERLSLPCEPSYHLRLKSTHCAGYERPVKARLAELRTYEVNVVTIRTIFSNVLTSYLRQKYFEVGKMTPEEIQTEVAQVAPICADACMSALYAKLRTIHRQNGTYTGRFNTPPTYSKDLELPLPFADAIQQFGIFESRGMNKTYLYVPVYPEGTKHEGRSSEEWFAYRYESYMPMLRESGIPLKSVDTRLKTGSAWWTYKTHKRGDTYDLECIIPPQNYSDHSINLISLFLLTTTAGNACRIINHKTDDKSYGYRARGLPYGIYSRAFSALCHKPHAEWNFSASMNLPL